ncbi:aromatic ring-hydroxylating dioxygenase subunit alpha [Paraburkholderia sp. BL10I2N1]|uniref:aromatic ring-hydroxylating oxygenase subunit alpha n=1 Tax=Paraburkholderia sp. BL10I2N1 TaxID=1938796 RepID=UPI0010615D14|nr:aromatic ring-hydroxylating dioxygenase subunit alpha [Paraburkholderia sp. BL10I2N1]TDN63069.1 Rieske 2Fe-2S family protein [Paraburkholderia sp. BL10I2N1]
MFDHKKLDALLATYTPGRPLAQAFYKDTELFEADLALIWQRKWLFAGLSCEIRQAGEWFTVQLGETSVIVVRDREGGVRAFFNTCRHRGSRICAGEKGKSGAFACPYHQWTYGLDGKLMFARNMGDSFDLSAFSLKPVACEVVAGYVFICLSSTPDDFSGFRRRVEPYLAPHGIEDAKIAYESTIVEKGNWKLVLENNRECYHCSANHPELLRTISEFDGPTDPRYGGQFAAKTERDEARWRQAGLPYGPVEEEPVYRMVRAALERGVSFTMTGEAACSKVMGTLPERDVGALRLLRFPNTWNHALGDHALAFRLLPLGPRETQVTTKWIVHKDAVEGVDYDLETLTAVWKATNAQDQRLVETNQLGINSIGYEPGVYSDQVESGVMAFVDWYIAALREGLAQMPRTVPLKVC